MTSFGVSGKYNNNKDRRQQRARPGISLCCIATATGTFKISVHTNLFCC